MNYLDNGGNLYLESANLGYDYNTTSFFEYLGITFLDDGGENEVVTLKGGCISCPEALKFYYLGGVSPHYSVDQLGSDGATLIMKSEDAIGRMFVNETTGYKVISSSIVIGAVANADSLNLKPFVFSEFLNYFMGYNPVTAMQENLQALLDGSSYPNPFRDETVIGFTLQQAGQVQVDIFNCQGLWITRLLNDHRGAGGHTILWDASNQRGEKVPKGYYLCRITSGNQAITRKLVLMQ